MRCIFCTSPASGKWALTVEHAPGDRERVIELVCHDCNRAIDKAGDAGVRLKATGERWFGGHIHGGSMRGGPAPWITNPRWPNPPPSEQSN